MQPVPDVYADVLLTYLQVIKQDSVEAAAAIQEIWAGYGSRAALRATLVVTLLKMEIQQKRYLTDSSIQSSLLIDYPKAVHLLERAITSCLRAWDIPYVEPLALNLSYPTDTCVESASPAPCDPSDFGH